MENIQVFMVPGRNVASPGKMSRRRTRTSMANTNGMIRTCDEHQRFWIIGSTGFSEDRFVKKVSSLSF